MRWVLLLILFLSLPAFIAYAKKSVRRREHLILAAGILMFSSGSISVDASIIGQPDWPGPVKGLVVSFIDIIAVALIVARPKKKHNMVLVLLFIAHLMVMILASFLAHAKMASLYSICQYIQLILLFIALGPEFIRPSALTNMLKGFAVGLTIQAIVVLYQKATGMVQAFGTTPHQNILGMMAQLTVFPIIAALLEGAKSKLLWLGAFSGAVCVALGGSRASLFFFAIGIATLFLITFIRKPTARKGKLLAAGLVACAVLVPLALGTLQARFGEAEIGTTDQSRIAFERAASAIADDYPLGVGPNNFVPVNNLQGYAAAAGIEWGGGLLDKPVHNAYLLARAETGWMGQAVLFLLLVTVICLGIRGAFLNRKVPVPGFALGSAVATFTIALHSNYEFAWFTMEIQRLFFVNAAIVAACITISRLANREAKLLLSRKKRTARPLEANA